MIEDVTIKLPIPHPAQKKIIDSKGRFKVLMCGRRFGKSEIAFILSIIHGIKKEKIAIITPEFGLAKDHYLKILSLLPKTVIKSKNQTDLIIELKTNGSIRFFSGNNIDAMRGGAYHLVILDEAAFIDDLQSAWENVIRPTLTDYKGKAIFISTPKGKNFFHAIYLKGLNREESFVSFHYSSYDNPYIDKEEIDSAKENLPEAVFNQEYLAIPLSDANNPFGTDNINKNIITNFSTNPTVVYGIDVAKTYDWSVITGLDESGSMTYFDRFKLSWELTKDKISLLPSDTMKVIDATGVGDVIYESLSMEVSNVEPFKFTGESKPKLIYELIKDVEKGETKYNQTTADEMQVFEFKYSSTGHIKFEAQSGYHDDCVMAIAMANHYRKFFTRITNWRLYHA
jgi:hypothetical protein